jgi:hypothetical protein
VGLARGAASNAGQFMDPARLGACPGLRAQASRIDRR